MKSLFDTYLTDLRTALESVDSTSLESIALELENARLKGKRVVMIGNGGSAATASHFACDFGKNAILDDENRFKAISLTDSCSAITAYGNDVRFDQIFVEQMKNLLEEGDVVIAISASGNSPDIVEGIRFAKSRHARVFGLSGFDGGTLKKEADIAINVPAKTYEQIEDAHMAILHILVTWFKVHSA